jgi:hypothetical protein
MQQRILPFLRFQHHLHHFLVTSKLTAILVGKTKELCHNIEVAVGVTGFSMISDFPVNFALVTSLMMTTSLVNVSLGQVGPS